MKKFLSIILSLSFLQISFAQQGISVSEGKDGIYLFYSNEIIGPGNSKGISSAVVFRSENSGAEKEIGRQSATFNLQELKNRFGNSFPSVTATYLNLKDENALIDYIRQHPSLDDYGLLPFDLYFMQAVGAVFFDKAKPAIGTKLKYRIKFLKQDGTELPNIPEGEIVIGRPLKFNPLRLLSKKENKNAIAATWQTIENESEPSYFANVYRQTGGSGAFLSAGQLMPAMAGDTITYHLTDEVKEGSLYKYFIRPTNIAGLEGNPSDTVAVIAADFGKVPVLQNFRASDSTGGFIFQWDALKEDALFTGIAIQRKPMSANDFFSIDTIPLTASFYQDSRVIPNIIYQYQFRLVNLRWRPLVPSATATLIHRTGDKNRLVPLALSASAVKQGIRVVWKKINHYDVNGYYVYRSANGGEMKLQSGLLKDTIFIDDDATNGRTLYTYRITSLNFSDVQSEYSNAVQGQPENNIIPIAPKGIISTTEPGKINLQWNNIKQNDEFVVGYNVYRAKGSVAFNKLMATNDLIRLQFTKLNAAPIVVPVFSDNKISPSQTYTYAVTSIDANKAESMAEQLVEVSTVGTHIAAPSFFSLVKTPTGIQLSWSAELNTAVTDYVIYRRSRTETTLQLLSTVKASQLNYLDRTAVEGTFYFYAIKAKTISGESDFSLEKGIAR